MRQLRSLSCLIVSLAAAACSAPQSRSDSGPTGSGAASRMHVASVAEAAGQPEVALSLYAAAARSEPDNVDTQLQYANAAARDGQAATARGTLSAALVRHPRDPALLRASAKLYLIEGVPAQALVQFRQAVEIQGASAPALTGEGVAQDMLGQHADARRLYGLALALDPANIAAANDRALSLLLDGHAAEAAAQFDLLRRRPDAPARVEENYALAAAAAGAPRTGQPPSGQFDALVAELKMPVVTP